MEKTSLKRFSVSLKGVPKDEVENALGTLLNSFNVVSVVIRKQARKEYDIPIIPVRKQARKGDGAEGGVL